MKATLAKIFLLLSLTVLGWQPAFGHHCALQQSPAEGIGLLRQYRTPVQTVSWNDESVRCRAGLGSHEIFPGASGLRVSFYTQDPSQVPTGELTLTGFGDWPRTYPLVFGPSHSVLTDELGNPIAFMFQAQPITIDLVANGTVEGRVTQGSRVFTGSWARSHGPW